MQRKENSHIIALENLQREQNFRHKNSEEKILNSIGHSRLLENEIKTLQEFTQKLKLRQQEEIKEIQVKIQEEEYKKWIKGLKQVEKKYFEA